MRVLRNILVLFILTLASFVFIQPANAATIIAPTSITANTTWTSDNVYVISGSSTVQPGVTLSIQPGTVVKFDSSYAYLDVKGTLQALGDNNNNIVFTAYREQLI